MKEILNPKHNIVMLVGDGPECRCPECGEMTLGRKGSKIICYRFMCGYYRRELSIEPELKEKLKFHGVNE